MIKSVQCAICGRTFETRKPNKKYCSFSCKEAGRKLQRMKWEDNHPGYNTDYMREYRKTHKEEEAV